jgi:hypothetical protein
MSPETSSQFDDYGWPVNPPGVGMGPNTSWKLEEFATIAKANMAIVHNINIGRRGRLEDPFPYFALDPTAGPGGYIQRHAGQPDQRLIGTSLRLAQVCQAEQPGAYRLGFIEQNPTWARCLNTRLAEFAAAKPLDLQCIDVMQGNYRDLAVGWVKRHVPNWGARGLITPDANGEFLFDTLSELGALRQLDRVDFAMHVTGGLLKWRKGKGAIQLGAALDGCQKRYWFVGRVRTNWQWAWFFGTNWPQWPDIRRIGLVSVTSDEGQARLETLCLTREERLKQHQPDGLFGDDPLDEPGT